MPLQGEEIYRIALRLVPKTVSGLDAIPPWVIPFARAIERANRTENRIAAMEALRVDAERYRWLKQNCIREVSDIGDLCLHFNCDFDHWDNVDAAIDAARQSSPLEISAA